MKDEIRDILIDAKSARIIDEISNMYGVSYEKATAIFYESDTSQLIADGVADLHCRSDKYLAGEIWREYIQTCKGEMS